MGRSPETQSQSLRCVLKRLRFFFVSTQKVCCVVGSQAAATAVQDTRRAPVRYTPRTLMAKGLTITTLVIYFQQQLFGANDIMLKGKYTFFCPYRNPVQFSSPPYTPPPMQRSFSSPENLQKSAVVTLYFSTSFTTLRSNV